MVDRNEQAVIPVVSSSVPATVSRPIPASTRGVVLGSLEEMYRWAKCVMDSGLAPSGFKNAQAVMVATQMGLELGLTPMAALQNVCVINGRPGIYGDGQKAVVDASGLMEYYSERAGRWCHLCEREADPKMVCPACGRDLRGEEWRGFIVTSLRRGQSEGITSGFNVVQAKQAGLWGKAGPWTQYPHRMLKFRARSYNLRDNFPDVLKGFRTAEELQDIEPGRIVEHRQADQAAKPKQQQWNDEAPHEQRKAKQGTEAAGRTSQPAARNSPDDKDVTDGQTEEGARNGGETGLA